LNEQIVNTLLPAVSRNVRTDRYSILQTSLVLKNISKIKPGGFIENHQSIE